MTRAASLRIIARIILGEQGTCPSPWCQLNEGHAGLHGRSIRQTAHGWLVVDQWSDQ